MSYISGLSKDFFTFVIRGSFWIILDFLIRVADHQGESRKICLVVNHIFLLGLSVSQKASKKECQVLEADYTKSNIFTNKLITQKLLAC